MHPCAFSGNTFPAFLFFSLFFFYHMFTFNNLKEPFSKLLIKHEEKTKEITTVKEVWICDPNYHKIRRSFALIFPKNYQCFEKLIKHSKECFIRYPNTSKLVKKNSAAPRFFNPLLSVWISDEPLFLVFDILLQ